MTLAIDILNVLAVIAYVWAIAFSLFMVLMIGALLVEEFNDWLEARRRQKCWEEIKNTQREWALTVEREVRAESQTSRFEAMRRGGAL